MAFPTMPARTAWLPFAVAVLIGHAGLRAETLVFPPYGHSYGIRKATPAHLFMFFGPRTFFRDPQGLATAKMISRDDTTTGKDDDEVVVYGVNSGRHELIYNTSMWTLGLYGKKGDGQGCFLDPKGVTCDEKGNVYVGDSGNNRVVRLFNPRREVEWVTAYTGKTATDGGLRGPTQVALTSDCHVFVVDAGNRRIVEFDSAGTPVRYIPGKGAAFSFSDAPTALAVGDGRQQWSYFGRERVLFCADSGGQRLWKFDFGGKVLGKARMPKGTSAGYGAADYYHNYWVTDQRNHCVVKFDRDLQFLDRFGKEGKGDNEFEEPRGIAIWKRYGQTFIAERTGAQYYWVGTDLKDCFLQDLEENRYRLETRLTEYALGTLFYLSGQDTVKLLSRKTLLAAKGQLLLKTKESLSARELVLRVEPTYSSRTYYHWDYPVRIRK